jgi:hypothetical protein
LHHAANSAAQRPDRCRARSSRSAPGASESKS